jgi:hypothetical protein
VLSMKPMNEHVTHAEQSFLSKLASSAQ